MIMYSIFKYSFAACFAGFVLDMIFGDPQFAYHPIRLIGRLISLVEGLLYKKENSHPKQLFCGAVTVLAVCTISVLCALCVCVLCHKANVWLGFAAQSLICYFMLAAKSLKTESMRVYRALARGDEEKARYALSMIVGRDTAVLDKKGITKAAVETVAENLSDGVIAPLFYMMLGGCVLGVFYKAVNTLDSMIGYKNDKYLYFGRFAARLDDVMNFVPSRLSALMLICAAFFVGLNYKNAARIFFRDRGNHASPNSAQTEAACAGALGVRLAGDAYYFGKLCKKPFIGDDLREINEGDIVLANRLMYGAAVLTMGVFVLVRLALQGGIL